MVLDGASARAGSEEDATKLARAAAAAAALGPALNSRNDGALLAAGSWEKLQLEIAHVNAVAVSMALP